MKKRNVLPLILIWSLTFTFFANVYGQEPPKKPPSFSDLLFKWERSAEVGNFLEVKARFNSNELIDVHPRYSGESRENMRKLIKDQTVIFIWLKNTGAEDVSASFTEMLLETDRGEKYFPSSFYAIDGEAIERDFVIAPDDERVLAVHYPKLTEPLGVIKLVLSNCRYTFVTFAVELEWDFGPLALKMTNLRKKKARLEVLNSELERLNKQLKAIKDEISVQEKEIKELVLKDLSDEPIQSP